MPPLTIPGLTASQQTAIDKVLAMESAMPRPESGEQQELMEDAERQIIDDEGRRAQAAAGNAPPTTQGWTPGADDADAGGNVDSDARNDSDDEKEGMDDQGGDLTDKQWSKQMQRDKEAEAKHDAKKADAKQFWDRMDAEDKAAATPNGPDQGKAESADGQQHFDDPVMEKEYEELKAEGYNFGDLDS